jgi:hypothetical protein
VTKPLFRNFDAELIEDGEPSGDRFTFSSMYEGAEILAEEAAEEWDNNSGGEWHDPKETYTFEIFDEDVSMGRFTVSMDYSKAFSARKVEP